MNRYRYFFGQFKRLYGKLAKDHQAETRAHLVQEISQGRTSSLTDLTDMELSELARQLRSQQPATETDYQQDANNQMRRKVIGLLREAGYQRNDKADMPRIYGWVKARGCGNGKALNSYTKAELQKLIVQAEKVKTDYYAQQTKKG